MTCIPPTTHLDGVQGCRPDREPDERRAVALRPPRYQREQPHDHPDDRGHPAVERVRRRQLVEGRGERPVHQRPVREDQRRIGRRDLGPEQQQGECRERRERREQREPLARAPARQVRGETGPDRDVDEQGDEQHRGGQVRGDGLAAVPQAHGLAPEPRLEPDERDRSDRRPQQRPAIAMVDPGEDRQADDLEPDDRRDRPVYPLDPRLGVVERGEQLAVAQRPIRAAQAGVGGADDDADRDEQDRRPERPRGELLEAGHGVSWGGPAGRMHRAFYPPTASHLGLGYASGHDPPGATGEPLRRAARGRRMQPADRLRSVAEPLVRGEPERQRRRRLPDHATAARHAGRLGPGGPTTVGVPADHQPGRNDRLWPDAADVLVPRRPERASRRPGPDRERQGVRPRGGPSDAGR